MAKLLQKQYQTVRDVKLFYSLQGKGSPALLIHGWPQTQDAWRHVVPLLTDYHTVITVDLPGIGESAPSKSGYSKKDHARYLHEVVDFLGYKKMAIIGHDLGGQVAYAY
jgi:pimeloyl-ACP methyl ester carboxylesterase